VVFQFQPKEQAKELTDTTDFSRVVLQFLPKEQAKELTDTTDFSRVVLQFLPDVPPTAKAETESPRD
jgi:FPC/CPF motif-containing protein YcgG